MLKDSALLLAMLSLGRSMLGFMLLIVVAVVDVAAVVAVVFVALVAVVAGGYDYWPRCS